RRAPVDLPAQELRPQARDDDPVKIDVIDHGVRVKVCQVGCFHVISQRQVRAAGLCPDRGGHDVWVRFETSRALDAIEQRLTTDPLSAGAVVDLTDAARSADLDGGRPAALLRLGQFVDALSRQLGDDGIGLYAVAERGAMSDTDFTSHERMVLRRWSDDGLIEVLPAGGP